MAKSIRTTPFTVRKLIIELSKCDPNAHVYCSPVPASTAAVPVLSMKNVSFPKAGNMVVLGQGKGE